MHHVALRVAEFERAAAFYCQVFGAELLAMPATIGPPKAARIVSGPPQTSLRLGMVALPSGPFIEFFQVDADKPEPARPYPSLPHVGLQVDSVPAALERAESLGGRRLWDEILCVGEAQIMYLLDPDGNSIDMVDVPSSAVIGSFLERNPEAVPSPAQKAAIEGRAS